MGYMKPLDPKSLPEFKEMFDRYVEIRGFIPNSILTMSRRPRIADAFMQLNQAILYEGSVSEELKMLISLIVSQTTGCRYCQAHMANLARRYKASDEKIRAVWEWEHSELFSDQERTALRFAYHASQVPNVVSEEDFTNLRQYFSDSEIVEIVATASLFGYLNRWNDTMATELEEHATAAASDILGTTGWSLGKHASSAY